MSHVHRLQTSDRIFFVTINLRRGLAPWAEEEMGWVTAALAASRGRLSFLLCGYVVMPDHWHALIGPSFPLTISRAVQDIKWISANSLNRARGTHGTVWQHQFWDRFVRHQMEFGQRLDYLHPNPVRKGLTGHPQDWQWSSYNNFALGPSAAAGCPIQIDPVHLPESYRG